MVSNEKVFQDFYYKLVKVLPMKDALFVAELYSQGLLPNDQKDQIKSLATQADMATHFLDSVIKPNLTFGIGTGGNFNKLLAVMNDSENQTVKELAEVIRSKLSSEAVDTNNDSSEPTGEPQPKKKRFSVIDVSRLKARYLNHLSTDNTDWPKQYVRLALVRMNQPVTRADKDLEETTKLTLAGQIDELLFKKEPLDDLEGIFYYQNKPCPRLILIVGGPGIGKTTLINEMCVKWAKDEFLTEKFDAVILIPLRSVQQHSLEKVMEEHVGKDAYEQLKESAGARCLIILEGLDEMALDRQQNDPFFVRLVKECTIFEKTVVLITSRPHACINIKPGRKIEVIGFGKTEIREYVRRSFPNSQTADSLLQQLDQHAFLRSLCYIPMNLVMVTEIFVCSNEQFPSTMTELYQTFVVMTFYKQLQRYKDNKPVVSSAPITSNNREKLLKVLPDIPNASVETVFILSKLAYHGLFDWYREIKEKDEDCTATWSWKDPKLIFTLEDLTHCGLNVTTNFDGLGFLKATHTLKLPVSTITYSFTHLIVQEFFAALYISILPQQEQHHLLIKFYSDYSSSCVFPFMCGLTKLDFNKSFRYILDNVTCNACCGSRSMTRISAMKYLYESKRLEINISPFILHTKFDIMLPYECLCASYVLFHFPVTGLYISFCYISDQGAEQLAKYFPSENAKCQLKILELWENNITIIGLQYVMKIAKTSRATLECLDVSANCFGDDGILMISEELIKQNDRLQVLGITNCGLSIKGITDLCKALELNHSLQELRMSDNNIGDDGIAVIASTLCKITIKKLDIRRCGIGIGAEFLAQALSVNKTLIFLQLTGNPIPVEGLRLILQSAVNNTVCEEVRYDEGRFFGQNFDHYHNDDEIVKMTEILHRRQFERIGQDFEKRMTYFASIWHSTQYNIKYKFYQT